MSDAREVPELSGIDVARPLRGPKSTSTLDARRSPLAKTEVQLGMLNDLDLGASPFEGDFQKALASCRSDGLHSEEVEILQLNLGRLCNMTCRHCHVDAGPDRWREVMDRETVDASLLLLDRLEAHTVDLTGGAPELNPHFRYLVDECVARGKHVIDRCNLTVLRLARTKDLPAWLGEKGVEIVCSLPHYRKRNTDAQRGEGAFERSIEVLKQLNEVGYGQGDPSRKLTVMVNPVGAFLAGSQCSLERQWSRGLRGEHGVTFDRLITLNNMPISRYLEWLDESGNLECYMELLLSSFNPGTVSGLMCRNTLSVGWDGRVYDCDFNQMLDLPITVVGEGPQDVWGIDPSLLPGRKIVTARHCFGCTAGAGSSCAGAIER